MTSFYLKLIAIITMLIDHSGAVLFNNMAILRAIGRLAFPIFCFLIVEGYYHTRDVKKYMLRLGIFAIISEIPFDLAFDGKILEFTHQNVYFTLLLGLVAIYIYDKNKNKLIASLSLICLLFVAYFIKCDYQYIGVLLIFVFYKYRNSKIFTSIFVALLNLAMGPFQLLATLSLGFIYSYNGKKGASLKYFFYLFYPVHLLMLYLINRYV